MPEHRLVPAQGAITIHDLLTHTSGLDSSGLGSAVAAWSQPGPEATLASHAPRYAGMLLDSQPGNRWGYSPRVGHDVVARIIEIVSGLPYDEFVCTRIFEPRGMTDTHFHLPPDKESRRVVIRARHPRRDRRLKLPRPILMKSGAPQDTSENAARFQNRAPLMYRHLWHRHPDGVFTNLASLLPDHPRLTRLYSDRRAVATGAVRLEGLNLMGVGDSMEPRVAAAGG